MEVDYRQLVAAGDSNLADYIKMMSVNPSHDKIIWADNLRSLPT